MEEIKKTNYLSYFKEGIDWNSVLTLMKVIIMTRDQFGNDENLSFTVVQGDKEYSIEKSGVTVCITCSDGRKMIVKYDLNAHNNYQRGYYYAADASVIIEINDHSAIVLSSILDWIDVRYKTIYLDNRDITSFNTAYVARIPELGINVSYDYISDDTIHAVGGESFNITADIEKELSSLNPSIATTVREAKGVGDNLTNAESAHSYVESKVFSEDELDYLVGCLIKETNEKYADKINQFWDEFYNSMEYLAEERKTTVVDIHKSIEGLLPSEREALLTFLEKAISKDKEKIKK